MNTITRLSSLMLICGCALLLFGPPADLHAQQEEEGTPSLEVRGDRGKGKTYHLGQDVRTIFYPALDGVPQLDVDLEITTIGIDNLNIARDPATAEVTVTGAISLERGSYIQAVWVEKQLTAREEFIAVEAGVNPALIVVKSPDPKAMLKVGDTFTQMINIENRGAKFDTLPLSAWQMDVVYNPEILKVLNVMHGDFLTEGGDVNTHYVEMLSPGKVSVSESRPGLTSPPVPMPPTSMAPSPEGVPLAPGGKETLLTIEFEVLAFAEEALGIHNVQLQSCYMDNDGMQQNDRISYSILVSDVFVATEHQSMHYATEDVNMDEMVNVLDLMEVANMIGSAAHGSRADVNGDGFVNVLDLVTVYKSDLWAKAAPATMEDSWERDANEAALTAPSVSRSVDPTTIRSWIDLARVEDDGSAIFDAGIAKLEALLASKIPSETKLLLNYPNPFNPETWIPYQLAKATEVTLTIHAMNGSLIRTLALGHQAAGVYKSKSQAAYWDGRNELGEQVASGLYFYTLTAGDFSATGKMLVRK